jgi:AAA+ superfamily predicted ATPase
MARSKKACIVFFDEVDAIGGARFDDGVGGDNEVQRTMLEIVNQLDGFDARGNIKVLMATNRFVKLAIYHDFSCVTLEVLMALSQPRFSVLKIELVISLWVVYS